MVQRVAATQFQQNVGVYSDAAMREPVIITSHQRDRLVLMSAEDYRKLVEAHEDDLIKRQIERHSVTLNELAKR
jgi:prevent-host-death family protein